MTNNKESLQAVIAAIKLKAIRNEHVVTDEEIARNVLISIEQLEKYLNGKDDIPDDLVPQLLALFGFQTKVIVDRVVKDIQIPDDNEEPDSESEK